MHRYIEALVSCAEEALIMNGVGAAIALGALFVSGIQLSDSFGFIILIESTGLMLVGGALGVAGQATTRKITEMITRKPVDPKTVAASDARAAVYAVTGVLLFAEGAIMTAVLS